MILNRDNNFLTSIEMIFEIFWNFKLKEYLAFLFVDFCLFIFINLIEINPKGLLCFLLQYRIHKS